MNRRIQRAHALIGAAAVCSLLVVPIALAGSVGGSGGPEATASSVQKQLKKLKKRVNNLEQQVAGLAKQPGPQGPPGAQGQQGVQGQQGLPGQDATNLFAFIRDTGSADAATVQYGSGVAVSDPAGNSSYQVFFNQSLVNCVVQAVAGTGDPPGGAPVIGGAFPTVDMSAATANEAFVTFIDTTATVRDTSFLITAFC
jgi:hypothetical protein